MSLTVFLVAAVPGILVLIVGVRSNSIPVLTIAALIGAAIGIFTGNPAYMAIDLLAVAFAWYIGFQMIIGSDSARTQTTNDVAPIEPDKPDKPKGNDISAFVWIVIAIVGFFLWKSSDKPLASAAPSAEATKQGHTIPNQTTPASNKRTQAASKTPKKVMHSHADMTRCLDMKTDTEIAKCADES